MQIVGIVAEYNPFHNGHAYQMEKAREITGAEAVVVAMGGNYTQRGEFALMNKFARAEAAVKCGADLVLELPLPFSVANAERFALGGVSLLGEFCTTLSCGCECADTKLLETVSEKLGSADIKKEIFANLKTGKSYPQAVEMVLGAYDARYAELIRRPNNILACEYLKAIKRLGLHMGFSPVMRVGAAHDEELSKGRYASGSMLRRCGMDDVGPFVPNESKRIIEREWNAGRIVKEWPEVAVLSYLRRMSPVMLSQIQGCHEGLEFRIYEALQKESTVLNVIERVTTKRYPSSRIRRILLSAYLGIGEDIINRYPLPPYLRVLALNQTGQRLLAERKKEIKRPILVKGAHYKAQSDEIRDLFLLECMADDLYTSAYRNSEERRAGSGIITTPFYFNEAVAEK